MSESLDTTLRTSRFSTLHKYKSELNTDSVEWCPHRPYQHFFVCANYQLIVETQQRIGRILLFSISPGTELKLCQTITTPGVLDQKWCNNKINNYSILGVANAVGAIEIYKFNGNLELITSCTISCDTLILSLDWSKEQNEIICSDSKGNWHKLQFSVDQLQLINSYKAHKFEAWIASFYYWNANIFYTGGDDSILLKFDSRTGLEPVTKNKTHEAGVTSIHTNTCQEFIVATGSYDENVRLWDVRNLKEPSSYKNMPGPVWRLKWDPFTAKSLLSACMLGGLHILNSDLEIIQSYCEHESMVYGADWSYLDEFDRIVASCSFYDNLLCVTKIDKD